MISLRQEKEKQKKQRKIHLGKYLVQSSSHIWETVTELIIYALTNPSHHIDSIV